MPIKKETGAPKTLEFPEHVCSEGASKLALEVSIDFLPKKFDGQWLDTVRRYVATWVAKHDFEKKATLWMWGTMSVNLVSRHPDHQTLSWSEFIIQFGLPKAFLPELEGRLRSQFDDQVAITEELSFQFDDGWTPICHVERGIVWKPDDPDSWVPVNGK